MPVHDNLGIRMKEFYEHVPRFRLTRRTPVAIRLDGKAFHTFTRGFERPFDERLGAAMRETMKYLCENIQGCVLGYTQSDEITLILIDYQTLTTEAWFNYEIQKMCSISASMATMAFNKFFEKEVNRWIIDCLGYNTGKVSVADVELKDAYIESLNKGAMFDARCFNIPKEEVANLIYWRQLDATRNSIQMVGQANFSHKELQNKSCNDIQDMLFKKRNINWNDFPAHLKRGSCCIKVGASTVFAIEHEDGTVETGSTERPHWEIDLEIPIFKNEGREYINRRILYKEKPEITIACIN